MLPGVECARRRRLHQGASGGGIGGCSHDSSTRRSMFCLYTTNAQPILTQPSSLHKAGVVNQQAYLDEKLGGEAREAKRRLDEKFAAHMKSENQRFNHKRKSLFLGLWQQLRSN